ncbi:transposase [bacterium]|nr:transposase [bacterium]
MQRVRAELIVQVRSGTMTAAEAARRLGVSRKTYYKWEQRGLAGLMKALDARAGGRPKAPRDEERTRLRRENERLKRRVLLAEQRAGIQQAIEKIESRDTAPGPATKKKERDPHDDR